MDHRRRVIFPITESLCSTSYPKTGSSTVLCKSRQWSTRNRPSRSSSLYGTRRGSRVIRGNLLVIPIENSFLYVEPVYLVAEQVNIPQLIRVIVAYGSKVSMQPTLEDAMRAVFGGIPAPVAPSGTTAQTPPRSVGRLPRKGPKGFPAGGGGPEARPMERIRTRDGIAKGTVGEIATGSFRQEKAGGQGYGTSDASSPPPPAASSFDPYYSKPRANLRTDNSY